MWENWPGFMIMMAVSSPVSLSVKPSLFTFSANVYSSSKKSPSGISCTTSLHSQSPVSTEVTYSVELPLKHAELEYLKQIMKLIKQHIYVYLYHDSWQDVMLQSKWNKKLREMQILRAGCRKAEPEIFTLPQTPFPEAQDSQNLISWRWSLTSPTYPVWWRSVHAISSYRGNIPTHTQTHRQDRLQYTPPLSLACSVITILRTF